MYLLAICLGGRKLCAIENAYFLTDEERRDELRRG